MAQTPNLGITLIEQSQAQKEVTANEAFYRIDALLNRGVLDRGVNTPPGSPALGDAYIVGSAPTGAWIGHANHIAYFQQIWRFIVPNTGSVVWVNDEYSHYVFQSGNWELVVRLQWYQQGSFTPVVFGVSTAGTAAYAQQYGRFTRIGNVVYYTIGVDWSAHTGTGNLRISGLPFTSNADAQNISVGSVYFSNLSVGAGLVPVAQVEANSTELSLQVCDATAGAAAALAIDAAAKLRITGHYFV
jgi:hypothetical protein